MAHRELYLAPPGSFNDPFDMKPYINLADPTERQMARARAETAAMISPQAVPAIELAILDPSTRQKHGHLAQAFAESVRRQLGVFCMAESRDDILMWSHYADCHRGLCVEFDVSRFPRKFRNSIRRVTYADERPRCHMFDDLGTQMMAYLVKSRAWQYEKEWRGFGAPGEVLRFGTKAVSAVILGCQIRAEDEAVVRQWLARWRPRPRISRAVLREGEFGLDIVPAA